MKKITAMLLAIIALFALAGCRNRTVSQPIYPQAGTANGSNAAPVFHSASDMVTVYLCTELTEGDTRYVMEYDKNGNLLLEITYENGVETDRTAHSLTETTEAEETTESDNQECTYDEKGNLICQIARNDNGKETMRYEYQYNARGKMTRYDQYYLGEHCGHKVFTYNADGNLTETIQYDRDRVYRHLTFHYTGDGQLDTVLYSRNTDQPCDTYRYETFRLSRQQAEALEKDAIYPMVILAD